MAISEVPRQCSIGYRAVSMLPKAVYELHWLYGSHMWGRLRKERHCTVTQWSLAARYCLFRMGPQYGRQAHSVNRLRWLRAVCVDIRAMWCPSFLQQFSWMISTDPIDDWGEYANSLTVWFLEVTHFMGGSRWFQFLVDNVSTTELFCVAHWNIWLHLQSSSWFAPNLLSFHCRRWWGPSKLFIVGMRCFEVFLQCPDNTWLQTLRCVV